MSEFNIQSESIDVEQIMQQVRSRIRDKRGQDYTEAEIRKLANVKLERFLNPHDVRSDLVKHYRQRQNQPEGEATPDPDDFDVDTIYRSARPGVPGKLLFWIRKRLNFILKFFVNPVPITDALHSQQQLNRLNFELMNNLVVEMTRLAIEMKNLKMRVESIAARLDFDERRGRALEGVVQYREGGAPAARSEGADETTADGSTASPERKRRRRRRGRRRSGSTPAAAGPASPATDESAAVERTATATESHGDEPAPPPPQPATREPSPESEASAGTSDRSSDEAGSPKQ
ncbi:MAG: hypothetical protein V3T48_07700 [Vicinamibacterales bacterium]